jgi:DNA-binding transcriptional LysR family regulator
MIDSIAAALFSSQARVDDLEKQADISIAVNNSRYLLNAIQHDKLDLAFIVQRSSMNLIAYDEAYVAAEPLAAVCHISDSKAVKSKLKSGKIERFISYDQNSNTRRLIEESMKNKGISIKPVFFSTSPDVILRLVLLRKGVAVLPYSQVSELVEKKKLYVLGNPAPIIIERKIAMISRKGKFLYEPLDQIRYDIGDILNKDFIKIKNYNQEILSTSAS